MQQKSGVFHNVATGGIQKVFSKNTLCFDSHFTKPVNFIEEM